MINLDNVAMQQVHRFSKIGEQFCELIDLVDSLSSRQFIGELVKVLGTLYAAAVDLHEVDDEVEVEEALADNDWWENVHRKVGDKLGHFNLYEHNFDSYIKGSAIRPTSIGDDIGDIYSELKAGLVLWDTHDPHKLFAAVWKWRFNFYIHWGAHLTDALRALHRVVETYYKMENGMM